MTRELAKREWPDALCPEITPALDLLRERHGIGISQVTFDLKSAIYYIELDKVIPTGVLAELRLQFAGDSRIGFDDTGMACREHWTGFSSPG
jgi:hypothetical protein